MSSTGSIHVALDGHSLVDGSRYRGIGTYVRNLIQGLAARPDLSLSVLGPDPKDVPLGVRTVPLPQRAPIRFVPSNSLRLAIARAEHSWHSARALRRLDAALFHSAGQDLPRTSAMPFVQTIQDLTPLVFDHPLLERHRRWWERQAQRVRGAAAVIVPSQSTADQVTTLLSVKPHRVHVIPHATDVSLTARPPHTLRVSDPPYLLVVSVWGPHKGFREASEVIARLSGSGYRHRLRIVGRLDNWLKENAWADVVAGGGADRTELVGYADDLSVLYRGATALISTSRAEGFGLPVLEAMAHGTPVVAFANTSLPEVVGNGGTLVPDGDTEAMTSSIRRILDSEAEWEEASQRASAWANRFSWKDSVDAHVSVYRMVSAS